MVCRPCMIRVPRSRPCLEIACSEEMSIAQAAGRDVSMRAGSRFPCEVDLPGVRVLQSVEPARQRSRGHAALDEHAPGRMLPHRGSGLGRACWFRPGTSMRQHAKKIEAAAWCLRAPLAPGTSAARSDIDVLQGTAVCR
jgi:hypothetical protein